MRNILANSSSLWAYKSHLHYAITNVSSFKSCRSKIENVTKLYFRCFLYYFVWSYKSYLWEEQMIVEKQRRKETYSCFNSSRVSAPLISSNSLLMICEFGDEEKYRLEFSVGTNLGEIQFIKQHISHYNCFISQIT